MAAVSFPSESTTQVSGAVSSSSSRGELRFSHIPQSYTQICSLTVHAEPAIINTLMHTVKNICKIKDAQHRDYRLTGSDQTWTVVMCLPGREVTILGCDFKCGVFFSHSAKEIPFYKMVKSFMQPLTEEQNLLVADKRCQHNKEAREVMAKLIKDLFQFAPPHIACDAVEENDIQKPQTQSKYLPLAEAFTSDSLLKELVCRNQGLFFGHVHPDIDKIATLFKSSLADQLSQLGVKHLYVELPAARLYQQFALFNHNDPKHNSAELRALEERLKECRVSDYKKILEICLVAKMHGIGVWPVDMSVEHLSEIASLESAVTQRNRIILKNIRYYSSLLTEGNKYAGLFGAMHHQVGSDLCIPNIRITLHGEALYDEPLPHESESNGLQELDESRKEMYALQEKLYAQLSPEDELQFKNSPDALLTILPGSKEFTLELHKK